MGLGSLGLDPTPITGTDPNEATNRINLHTHTGNPGEGDQIDSVNVINTPAGDITADNTQAAINELNVLANLGRVHVPVRQTVLSGHIGIDGYPDFLVAGSGLSINILASLTPLIIAFAYNFNELFGQIDFVKSIDQDIPSAWSALPANQTCYLYIDRNIETGVLSYGYSLLAPVYEKLPPGTPTADQHWFDLNSYYMKRWSGTTWDVKQRVFVGECSTNASSVTSVVCYALQGKYDSGWFSFSSGSSTQKSHNIGVLPRQKTCYGATDANGTNAGDWVYFEFNDNIVNHMGGAWVTNIGRNQCTFRADTPANIMTPGVPSNATHARIMLSRGF
jgi:hypothetical protein